MKAFGCVFFSGLAILISGTGASAQSACSSQVLALSPGQGITANNEGQYRQGDSCFYGVRCSGGTLVKTGARSYECNAPAERAQEQCRLTIDLGPGEVISSTGFRDENGRECLVTYRCRGGITKKGQGNDYVCVPHERNNGS